MTTITIDGKQYAIVPVEATEKMIHDAGAEDGLIARDIYVTMLRAAQPVPLSAVLQAMWRPIEEAEFGKPYLMWGPQWSEPGAAWWTEEGDGDFEEPPTHFMPLPPEPSDD